MGSAPPALTRVASEGEWERAHRCARQLDTPVLALFDARHSAASVKTRALFEELASEYGSLSFVAVDVDDNEDVAYRLGIEALPTIVLFKDGAIVEQLGTNSDDGLRAIVARQLRLQQLSAR